MAERKRFLLDEIQNPRNPAGIALPLFVDGGLNVRPRSHPLGLGMHFTDPALWAVDFDDFTMRYAAADWTITKIGTGGNALTGGVAGQFGTLGVTNSAASGDSEAFTRPSNNFALSASQPFAATFRFQVDDAVNADVAFGFQALNTTPFTDPANGVWWKKVAGASFNLIAAKASVQSVATAVVSAVTSTNLSLELCYDGLSLWYGANGAILGSLPNTNIPTVGVCTTFAVRNNSAAARTINIDYFMAAQYRG